MQNNFLPAQDNDETLTIPSYTQLILCHIVIKQTKQTPGDLKGCCRDWKVAKHSTSESSGAAKVCLYICGFQVFQSEGSIRLYLSGLESRVCAANAD
ncbi:hypothetical protein Chor_017144 [Crotalus horridus]